MSTKISALQERLVADIVGDEFFPIIDGGSLQNPRPAGDPFGTYKIRLDTLFASGQGYEKVTSLDLTADSNNQFKLTYTKEDNSTDVITIDKYAIQDNDVAFTHINPAGYITSTETIQANLVDNQLVTPLAVDNQITYRQDLYDVLIKGYIGDDDSGVLIDFATLTNVADDFTALLDGVNANLNTFKKIENKFATIDYSDKIGISQVNLNHFRINRADISTRLNIKDKGITTVLLNDSAVTPNKLAPSAVETNKIKDRAVTTDKLNDSSVTAIKIQNGVIGYDKLSPGKPEWDEIGNLRVANRVEASSDITTQGRLRSYGTDFHLYSADRSGGNVHLGRALVHNNGDKLVINYARDYTGGVEISGAVSVPDLSVESIKASTNGKLVVTKDYVDEADVLLNPIAGDKIQDNAIALNHMSDDSVGTFEIIDDSITSAKIENTGPQWDAQGNTTIYNNLITNGNILKFGTAETTTNGSITLLSGTGIAKLEKLSGVGGDFTISNNGAIKLKVSGTDRVTLESSRVTSKVPVVIDSDYTTIGGVNISNPLLKLTGSTPALGSLNLDSNEIVQQGSSLYLGVVNPTQDIYFRQGANNLASIDGETGDLFVSGAVRKSDEFGQLHLYGGASASTGATINLYGSESSTQANSVLYTGYSHTFRNAGPADSTPGSNTLEITQNGSIVAPRFTLNNVAANPKSLVTKEYITQEISKVFPDDHYLRKIGGVLTGGIKIGTSDANLLDAEDLSEADLSEADIDFITNPRSAFAANGTNIMLEGNSKGVSGVFFESSNKRSDGAFIQYHSRGIGNTTGEQSDLVIGVMNDDTYGGTIGNNDKIVFNTPGRDQLVITYDAGVTEHKIWHEGNDGHNSGLDADKLDGNHASTFATSNELSTLRADTNTAIGDAKAEVLATTVPLDRIETISGNTLLGNYTDSARSIQALTLQSIITNSNAAVPTSGGVIKYTDGKFALKTALTPLATKDEVATAKAEVLATTVPLDRIETIAGHKLLGNSGSTDAAPSVITLQTTLSDTDSAVSTSKAVKTYVDSKGFATGDDITGASFLPISGGTLTGNLAFSSTTDRGLDWNINSDYASIKFHSTGDADVDTRLEFKIGDNNNEYFIFTHQPSGGTKYDLLKISNTVLDYKGNKVWHDGNTTNAVVNTTIQNGSVSANKLSTGAPSWDTSKNLFVKGKLRLGEPVSGTTPGTEIYAERLGSEDILTVYANDKIVFQNGDRLPTMALDHDGNKVIIGSDTILLEQGKLHIDSAAVPLSFRETDQTGGGSFWRMPLDYESLRFDSSNDGTTFGTTGYTNVFQMYKDGRVIAPNLTKELISTNRSLVTKEYVASIESSLEDKFANHNHSGNQTFAIRTGETHGGHFVSKFTSTSSNDGGGILIDVTDNNGDEEAISIYNDYFNYPVFRVKSQTGNTKIRGELEAAGSITSDTSIAIPGVLDISSTAISYKTNEIWHAGNDGSGSGLNADLLDGYHASDFAKPYTNILINRPTQDYHAATKEYVDGVAKTEVVGVLESVYPVGSVYTNINSTNPNTLFGFGTWQTFGAGRVLVGVDSRYSSFNASQKTGGSKTHTLTIDQMPSHSHTLRGNDRDSNSAQKWAPGLWKDDAETAKTTDPGTIQPTGGGAAHNNMQPYITVYMWLRTA